MAYTINFEHDFVGAEELQLLKTKQAILEKLRVKFGEAAKAKAAAPQPDSAKGLPHHHSKHTR
jgi:hypothetical protein